MTLPLANTTSAPHPARSRYTTVGDETAQTAELKANGVPGMRDPRTANRDWTIPKEQIRHRVAAVTCGSTKLYGTAQWVASETEAVHRNCRSPAS